MIREFRRVNLFYFQGDSISLTTFLTRSNMTYEVPSIATAQNLSHPNLPIHKKVNLAEKKKKRSFCTHSKNKQDRCCSFSFSPSAFSGPNNQQHAHQ